MSKKKQKQARPNVTDVSSVRIGSAGSAEYVVSRSYAEVVDLISEGEIEGVVSGSYAYKGDKNKVTEGDNPTGYSQVTFTPYTATGEAGTTDAAQMESLGFLRSVYWNQVPVVDKDGYYNFASISVDSSFGIPIGHKPSLNASMNNYTGLTGENILDLSIHRSIGERLYGPEIEGGGLRPTSKRAATLKAGVKIDKYSKTYSILNKECSQIHVSIKIAGLFEQVQAGPKTYKKSGQLAACAGASTGYGDMKARTVAYNIYYQPIFDERFPTPSNALKDRNEIATAKWIGPIRETVTGKLDSPYIRTTIIPTESTSLSQTETKDSQYNYRDQVGFEGWRIRIVRTTPESLTSFLRNTTFVDSITEVYGTTLRYPYSSMIYSQFDARSFSRIPSRAYDTRLIKVKVPNNYDPILKTYGKSDGNSQVNRTGTAKWDDNVKSGGTLADSFWNGDFKNSYWDDGGTEKFNIQGKYLLEWTDNPAWCFYDMMTNPRYGLGDYIDASEIDKWSLYEIAQYCDVLVPDGYGSVEPRFTINHLITNREEAYKVMNDLASIFRGIIFYANGNIFAVQDKYKKPVYQFNNSNVGEGNFSYASSSKKARHTVAIVRYNDKKDLFKPAIEYVENEEAVRRYGIREIETSALGCTSRGQARRFAQWILASEAEETETVSFTAGQEGAYLHPGDVIQIYDNFRSSLKYSGRTNAVRALKLDGDVVPANVIQPVIGEDFDSVVVDAALNFTSNKLYKFSMLTPTYNYDPSGTAGLTSKDDNAIRRSQVQHLIFSGAHTFPLTGNQRSDYYVSGSGVCTEIFFNTGNYFGGTGNSLNFDDYVITGYTNTGVNTDGSFDTSASYSGDCFSGENLIWSIEPYGHVLNSDGISDPNDTEFVSGNFSDFRVINVKENDNGAYDVAALAYSTGKYERVESSVKLGGKNIDLQPLFPSGENTTNTTMLGTSALEAKPGIAFSETTQTANYKTIDIKFDAAGYTRAKETGEDGDEYTVVTEEAQNDLTYLISVLESDPDTIDGKAVTAPTPFNASVYGKNVVETINGQKDTTNPRFVDNKFVSEILITSNVIKDYWVVVFAISPQGIISQGMAKKLSLDEDETAIFSIVDNILINGLKTAGDEGDPRTVNDKLNLLRIDASEPGFTWNASVKGILSAQEGNSELEPSYPLSIPEDSTQYRITVRKPSKTNKPSDYIYVELTGYNTQTESPSFVFQSIYNDPNAITGYVADADVFGYNTDGTSVGNKNAAPWLSVPKSGFNIRNSPDEFPIRNYDVVVEAHDSQGNTSATNKIFQDTIGHTSYTSQNETWKISQANNTYDILGVSLTPPESMCFTQIQPDAPNVMPGTQYLTPARAYQYEYPYLAKAQIYPNGWLEISIEASENSAGEIIETEEDIENRFNNAAGLIYYYTTGDGRINFDDEVAQMTNPAPPFTIKSEKIKFTEDGANWGNESPIINVGTAEKPEHEAFGGIVQLGAGTNTGGSAGSPLGVVHRGVFLLNDGDSLSLLRLPFPNVSSSDVENIELSFGIFDEFHLLSAFETDGSTPKTRIVAEKTANDPAHIVKDIFLEKNINFSASTEDVTSSRDEKLFDNNMFGTTAMNFNTSIYLNESSITSAGDVALAFRAWGEIYVNVGKGDLFAEAGEITLTPENTKSGDYEVEVILKNIPDYSITYTSTPGHQGQQAYYLKQLQINLSGFPTLDPDKTTIFLLPETAEHKVNIDKMGNVPSVAVGLGSTTALQPMITQSKGWVHSIEDNEIIIVHKAQDIATGSLPRAYRIKFGILVTNE